MNEAATYWSPVCKLVSELRCWVRLGVRENGATVATVWSMLLTMPEEGYLESSEGPVPFRDVEWVEISTKYVVGGMAGRPRRMVDIKDDIVGRLQGARVAWELRDSSWSIDRIFDEEPVQVVRVLNGFGPPDSSRTT